MGERQSDGLERAVCWIGTDTPEAETAVISGGEEMEDLIQQRKQF